MRILALPGIAELLSQTSAPKEQVYPYESAEM